MALTSSFKGNFVNNIVQASMKGKSQNKHVYAKWLFYVKTIRDNGLAHFLQSTESYIRDSYIGDFMNDTLNDGSILLWLVEALITENWKQNYSNTIFSFLQLRLLTFSMRDWQSGGKYSL